VSVQTPGGGGFGDPRLRAAEASAADARNGYLRGKA
jgi:N-methylhydantoinase B/oxoprolinase/acetone carboxylase alpha subunit